MPSRVTFSVTRLKIALLVSMTLVSGCVTPGASDSCAGWKPIILAKTSIDGLTEQDSEEILAHNEYGVERGCWKPANGR